MKLQLILALAAITAHAATPARVTVQPSKARQPYQGLGCGAMFYEGHITSLLTGKRQRHRVLSAERTLVVHLVNTAAMEVPLQISIGGNAAPSAPATRHRTSEAEDSATLEPLQPAGGGFADTLPSQSLTSYQFTIR
jgi:hypothetical protein